MFLSQRALDKLKARKTKPGSYNLDLNLIGAAPLVYVIYDP